MARAAPARGRARDAHEHDAQKLYIGLGRGTAKYEYDAFGIEMGEARERFSETWEVLDLAMTRRAVHV